jgi:chorismate mutase / prephenate dehydratase
LAASNVYVGARFAVQQLDDMATEVMGIREGKEIGFLGPDGTFAHLAARQRFTGDVKLVGQSNVKEVFEFVAGDRSRLGLVPIENSSGGTIYDTVDQLINPVYGLFIQELVSLNVRLALLGKTKDRIRVIYSHFAPILHCAAWAKQKYPDAKLEETKSTTLAAKLASKEDHAAAIGTRFAGEIYDLDVLEFPIGENKPNVTQFVVVGHEKPTVKDADRMSLVATLPNHPGSLYDFLGPLANAGVNMLRITSRPIIGKPNSYTFLIDLAGSENDKSVQKALKQAAKLTEQMRSIGSYRLVGPYDS